MICEVLGCLPSEINEKHPNMTRADRIFMARYCMERWIFMGETIGLIRKRGTLGGKSGS